MTRHAVPAFCKLCPTVSNCSSVCSELLVQIVGSRRSAIRATICFNPFRVRSKITNVTSSRLGCLTKSRPIFGTKSHFFSLPRFWLLVCPRQQRFPCFGPVQRLRVHFNALAGSCKLCVARYLTSRVSQSLSPRTCRQDTDGIGKIGNRIFLFLSQKLGLGHKQEAYQAEHS